MSWWAVVLVALVVGVPAVLVAADRTAVRRRLAREVAEFEAVADGLADVAIRGRAVAGADLYLVPPEQ